MNVIILGFGFMGKLYFNKLVLFNNVNIIALFDKNFFKHNHSIKKKKNFNGFVSNDIYFIIKKLKPLNYKVIITLPNHLHRKFINLFYDKHILVEKPLLPNYSDFKNLYNQNFVFCALIERFNPAFSFFFYFVFPFFKNYIKHISFVRINNKKNNVLNILTDTSIHDLDLALCFFNYKIPKSISSKSINNRAIIKFQDTNSNCNITIFSSINSFKRTRSVYLHINNNSFFLIDLIATSVLLITNNKVYTIFRHNKNIDQLHIMINSFINGKYNNFNSLDQSKILSKILDNLYKKCLR